MPGKKSNIINREISWLQFNERVLQEASDPTTPLINRLKFLGIYSNNLDEFFRVRVATVNRMTTMEKNVFHDNYLNPRKTLREINRITKNQQKEFQHIYNSVIHELAEKNIFVISDKELTVKQGKFVEQYFRDQVRPCLFPIILSNLKAASLHDHSLYLAVVLQVKGKPSQEKYALVEVPVNTLSRFLILPNEGEKRYIILLDDVIRYCLTDVFSVFGFNLFKAYAIKFTRDAELDIDNDVSKSFLELMTEGLKQREVAPPVRFVYDRHMPERLLKLLLAKLNISQSDTVSSGGKYHNFKDFVSFPNIGTPEMEFTPLPPLEHQGLRVTKSILAGIKERDYLLHYPFQSFHYLIDLLREASLDPQVRAIKMTLYRVASNSNVVNALINAARNGKEVTVFLEVQARFDEEANIYWAGKMQQEGVRVIQSIPGYKVHGKLLLIRRKEGVRSVYYAGIGTGNFNETTAKVYTDVSIFTANKEIVADVNSVFHLFESIYNTPRFSKLLVAPFHMRIQILKLLNNEIRNAKAGVDAWMILKINNLTDTKIIKKLYEASNAGVRIKLIVRGICMLQPGVPKMSEKIEAITIVGRFLEHSRIMVFANAGNELYYISSADWMERNFDNRIEVACPIFDRELQRELMTMLQIQLRDNTKARLITPTKSNQYIKGNTNLKINSQVETYKFFKDKIL
jgi:polyphosphate kinase